MGVVKELPDDVVNQIKAGEVVERPLSVVKELVENALDADASEITVDIFDGGKALVRVTDTGRGMMPEDALLALRRHATSKIDTLEDLSHIATFGFRGEALASIASVSKFELRTRREEDACGSLVTLSDQTHQPELKPVASPTGTQIDVAELFYNTPARQKFLKNSATEYAHIFDFMQAVAFAFPHVSFTFSHNRRRVFQYRRASSLDVRAKEILGHEWDHFVSVNFEKGSFSAAGFASYPSYARSVPQFFLLFVNGRLVKDRVIRSGVLQAYSGLVMKGQIPSVILFIQCDPSWVDVNAHPSKTEVRFRDPLVLQDLVSLSLQDVVRAKTQQKMFAAAGVAEPSEPTQAVVRPLSIVEPSQRSALPMRVQAGPAVYSKIQEMGGNLALRNEMRDEMRHDFRSNLKSELNQKSPMRDSARGVVLGKHEPKEQQLLPGMDEVNKNQLRYLGQFSKLYLLFESHPEKELWVVDQHAFHERVLFEEYLKTRDGHLVARQGLLTPHFVPVPAAVGPLLHEARDIFLELGFEVEWIAGMDRLALHSYPAFLQTAALDRVFDEILVRVLAALESKYDCEHPLLSRAQRVREGFLEEGRNFASLRSVDMYHLFYATVACHSAVRAGESLTESQVQFLMSRANDVDFAAHCPHGRPVLRRFSLSDLDSWFSRT